jgi:hypothetical protein
MLALQILGMRGRRRKSGAAYLSTRTRKRPRGQTILTQECLLGSIVLTQKGIQECLLGSIVLTQKGIPGSILLIQDCMHTNSVCMHVVAKTKQKRQRPGRAARTRERCPPLAGRAPRRSPQRGGHTRVPGDSLFRSTKTNGFTQSCFIVHNTCVNNWTLFTDEKQRQTFVSSRVS